MRIHVNPTAEHLRDFTEQLPEFFDRSGEPLHKGRNTIKVFEVDGQRLAVKRFRRPSLIRAAIYAFRRSKARRSFEHAVRLRALSIDSPEPIAWSEYHRNGLLGDSYYISRCSEHTLLSKTTARFSAADTLPVLDAFARFAAQLHEKGIEHRDFNHGNILWSRDRTTDAFEFRLIDINRMHFDEQPLPARRCMVNLRRLSSRPRHSSTSSTAMPKPGRSMSTTRCCAALFSGLRSDAASRSASGFADAGIDFAEKIAPGVWFSGLFRYICQR